MTTIALARKPNKETVILGIDPGTVVMGFAAIVVRGTAIRILDMGTAHVGKSEDHYDRLKEIYALVSDLIRLHEVTDMAIEAPFFGKNVQSMLKLGRAQGVCIAAAMGLDVKVTEYAPREIKQSITGKGSAAKEQLAAMLGRLVEGVPTDLPLDATDALGVAVCHYFQAFSPVPRPLKTNQLRKSAHKSKGNWSNFLKDNPDRLQNG